MSWLVTDSFVHSFVRSADLMYQFFVGLLHASICFSTGFDVQHTTFPSKFLCLFGCHYTFILHRSPAASQPPASRIPFPLIVTTKCDQSYDHTRMQSESTPTPDWML